MGRSAILEELSRIFSVRRILGCLILLVIVLSAPEIHRLYQGNIFDEVEYIPNHLREIDVSSESLPIAATLEDRLAVWREAPGGRVAFDIPLEQFTAWNLERCDTIGNQENGWMVSKWKKQWELLNSTDINKHRMDLINHMEATIPGHCGTGRGVVMTAGNADTFQRVEWSVKMLRSYGSNLPVQFHFPSERLDQEDPLRGRLARIGVQMVEAEGQERDKGQTKSYHLKALAVLRSAWQEVLYLDSDSIPTRNPEYMFEAPNYKRLGLWATPDYWKTSAQSPIWAIIGVKCRNEWEFETGQMFIDKKKHMDTFTLIQYMLENHAWVRIVRLALKQWFNFSDGDKDIYRWALLALRKRWAVPGRWVGCGGFPNDTPSGKFCGHTMMQYDSWGDPLFVHYNLLKQVAQNPGRGITWGRTMQLPMFDAYPPTPAIARLGDSIPSPQRGRVLGDIDCDMLADADEHGEARRPASEAILRRAVREQGAKAGFFSERSWTAPCIDLNYVDPRRDDRKAADEARRERINQQKLELSIELDQARANIVNSSKSEDDWQREKEHLMSQLELVGGVAFPDWRQSPIEVSRRDAKLKQTIEWSSDPHLASFEETLFNLGFVPNGKGFNRRKGRTDRI